MKVFVVSVFVLLACCHASSEEINQPSELPSSTCAKAIVDALGNAEDAINDVIELLRGELGALSPLISTLKTLASDIGAIPSACGLASMVSINADCMSDINGVVSTIKSIGSAIGQLVQGDISVIGSIISSAKSLVGQLQQASSDCLS